MELGGDEVEEEDQWENLYSLFFSLPRTLDEALDRSPKRRRFSSNLSRQHGCRPHQDLTPSPFTSVEYLLDVFHDKKYHLFITQKGWVLS